jgi:hypothetical protein
MNRRFFKIAVVGCMVMATCVADFSLVACNAACYLSALGSGGKCPVSCCAADTFTPACCASHGCRSAMDRSALPSGCGRDCPQCPVCQAPIRQLPESKPTFTFDGPRIPIPWFNAATSIDPFELHQPRERAFVIVSSLHPRLQILYRVWRN